MASAAMATTIKEGVLTYSAGHYLEGQPLQTGYDPYGYNYQAHMFNGSYFNAYSGGAGLPPYEGDSDAYLAANPSAANHWAWPYCDVTLQMKWNDAWLSNKDCDADGKLDRHYGYGAYTGSGAWLTNHQSGTDTIDVEDPNGNVKTKTAHWTYFVKIVTPGTDDYVDGAVWYEPDGTEIGPAEWGAFAVVQEVLNDPLSGVHGKQYGSPAGPGFGQYAPE
jgi:hypothetical protein